MLALVFLYQVSDSLVYSYKHDQYLYSSLQPLIKVVKQTILIFIQYNVTKTGYYS